MPAMQLFEPHLTGESGDRGAEIVREPLRMGNHARMSRPGSAPVGVPSRYVT